MEAYHLIKDRVFEDTPLYDPVLLQAIGMDVEFVTEPPNLYKIRYGCPR